MATILTTVLTDPANESDLPWNRSTPIVFPPRTKPGLLEREVSEIGSEVVSRVFGEALNDREDTWIADSRHPAIFHETRKEHVCAVSVTG